MDKQHNELLTRYLSEQEQVTTLQAELEKRQSKLAVAQNNDSDTD